MAFGREGNVVMVNGRKNAKLVARAGARQRWRVVNTAKSQYFAIHLRDDAGVFTKIGSDGGLQEYPTQHEIVVVAPGERADLMVAPKGKAGTEIQVVSELFSRGYGSVEYKVPENLFRIEFAKMPAVTAAALPKIRREIAPLVKTNATPITLNLDIIQRPNPMTFEYQINGKPYWKATPLTAKIGETQVWTVNNTTPWSHPLHLHGFFFQVLDDKGEPRRPLEWKDTVDVPFKKTVQLLVKFDERPGNWMIHCHILDHAEGGLMTTIRVGDVTEKKHAHHP
jgi:FtsP/CotA-like multicopper oxidase with cupredoxin domain